MAGLDFFSLVRACLCRQSLLHGRDSQRPGLGMSCPSALGLQPHQGQGGLRVGCWHCPGPAPELWRSWCCAPAHTAQPLAAFLL